MGEFVAHVYGEHDLLMYVCECVCACVCVNMCVCVCVFVYVCVTYGCNMPKTCAWPRVYKTVLSLSPSLRELSRNLTSHVFTTWCARKPSRDWGNEKQCKATF